MIWYGSKAQYLGRRARFLPSAHAASSVKTWRTKSKNFFSPEDRMCSSRKFGNRPTALQKNRKRRRYRLLFIASVLACTSVERRFWTLTRSGQWFEIVETAFIEKE